MMRIAGRSREGLAKAIVTNEDGVVETESIKNNRLLYILKHTDTPIDIAAGTNYTTSSFEVGDYSFARLQINFQVVGNTVPTLEKIKVYVFSKPKGLNIISTASGIMREVKMEVAKVNPKSTGALVSSEEIPITNEAIGIYIENNSTGTVATLREIAVRLTRESKTTMIDPVKSSDFVTTNNVWDDGTVILAGGQHHTGRLSGDNHRFFRLQINFDESIPEGLRFYYQDANKSELFEGRANGMFAEIPIIKTNSILNSGNIVVISDGDIPIYNQDFRVVISNTSNVDVTLRNMVVRMVK